MARILTCVRTVSSGVALFVMFAGLPAAAAPCGAGETGGTIFRDVDADGVLDAVEPGLNVSGLSIAAYDATGSLLGSTSVGTDGQYSLGTLSSSALATGVRLELSGLPAYLKHGAVGTSSASSVRFISASGCSYNFALHNPVDYCESDPPVTLACYQGGVSTGNSAPAVVSTSYSTTGLPTAYGGSATNPVADIAIQSVGSVWGGAFDVRRSRLFVGAFLKRHVGLGAQGMGGVYVIDYSTTTASVVKSFTLQGTSPANGGATIDLGSVTRNEVVGAITGDYDLSTDPAQPTRDLDAYPKVGTTAYGDLALTEDGQTLWMVNLSQLALIRMDVSGATASLPGTVQQYLLSSLAGVPSCTGGTFRPFAIEFRDGTGYLGGVCDAQSSQVAADLSAHVLSFNPEAITSGFTSEIAFALNYSREPIFSSPPGSTTLGTAVFGTWRPWHTSDYLGSLSPYAAESVGIGAAQPILANIRFLPNGSMVLGFADRYSHQMGYNNYIPVASNTTTIEGMSGGDLILVCRTSSGWALEGSAGCSPSDSDSVLTNDGPNGAGEFFKHDAFYLTAGNYSSAVTHSETALGGVAVVPSSGEVLAVTFDPIPNSILVRTNGLSRFSASDGSHLSDYLIVPDPVSFPGYLGKAGGLGEPILRCAANPIEIGNRLWLDADSDGVQDPGETPLSGVTVQLCNSSNTVISTATTDTDGNYLFSSRVATSTASKVYSVSSLSPSSTSLHVCIPLSQAALSSYLVTSQNGDSTTNGDSRDSDCTSTSGSADITVSLGDVGANDHTYDCGFTTTACRTDLTPTSLDVDGSIKELKDTFDSIMLLRDAYAARLVCRAYAPGRRARLSTEAQTNYVDAWTSVWTDLPRTTDTSCVRTGLTCSTTSQVATKAEILALAEEIYQSAYDIITAGCMRHGRNGSNRVSPSQKARRVELRDTLATRWAEVQAEIASFPDSTAACS